MGHGTGKLTEGDKTLFRIGGGKEKRGGGGQGRRLKRNLDAYDCEKRRQVRARDLGGRLEKNRS